MEESFGLRRLGEEQDFLEDTQGQHEFPRDASVTFTLLKHEETNRKLFLQLISTKRIQGM